jgi:lipopolysaccharide biosynthesis protein
MMSELSTVPGLIRNWQFVPSPVGRRRLLANAGLFLRTLHRRPRSAVVKAAVPRPAWVVYFLFAPDGKFASRHRFTLSRLRDLGFPVLVVCATGEPGRIPPEVHGFCDALLWKDLGGYDFSAYVLALSHVARHAPGADVFVLNDSVFGPFTDLRKVFDTAPWDLTGFMGSSEVTNHIQSYAFVLKNVDRARMARLAPVFFPFASVSDRDAVIHLQELRMARVAARHMPVGALWYAQPEVRNPTTRQPMQLLDDGFPFLKHMLLTKPRSLTNCPVSKHALLDRLDQLGHPIDDAMRTLASAGD